MKKFKLVLRCIMLVILLRGVQLSANFNACTTRECLIESAETIQDYYKRDSHFLYGSPILEEFDLLKESREIINIKKIVDHVCKKSVDENVEYVAQLAINMRCYFLQGNYPMLIDQYIKHKSKLSEQEIYHNDDLVIKILYARVLWILGDRDNANEIEKEFISTYFKQKQKIYPNKKIIYYYFVTNQKEKLVIYLLGLAVQSNYSANSIWSCKTDFERFINNILFQERYPSGWSDEIIKKYSELYAENKEFRCKPLPKRFPRPGEK
ncbi:hypothetical protein EHQ13_06245 [Leptospira gomenensis]|uniref:Uncharacterized protein n=1 Tax=Leptospira gomenensis TaxID=2484974 RepID=A0A5F1YZ35_9LEPT|nr:hypothetical protein [Leptospira gomenensis]TGK35348.1 hypothetical protein EHQ17_06670 [Leptospira gomenensis]TGK45949.1 hypothetical protein EHQ07_07685 [Leptospira gomenensis]TGK64974.1 hypothetical protein EHQ13_06245 [Leptospira gomenensis]